jgi:hypothetical protein
MKIYKHKFVKSSETGSPISKEKLVEEIRILTKTIDRLAEENFGYAPDNENFDNMLEDRGKKLDMLKEIDFDLYIKLIDEI